MSYSDFRIDDLVKLVDFVEPFNGTVVRVAGFMPPSSTVGARVLVENLDHTKFDYEGLLRPMIAVETRHLELVQRHIGGTTFKGVVLDSLVTLHIYQHHHDDDPKRALDDLIRLEVEIALDPKVSKPAQDLVESHTKALRNQLHSARKEIERLEEVTRELTARLLVATEGSVGGFTSKDEAERAAEFVNAVHRVTNHEGQWLHSNGHKYTVVGIANLDAEPCRQKEYPAMVVYRGEDDRLWAKAPEGFLASRTEVPPC